MSHVCLRSVAELQGHGAVVRTTAILELQHFAVDLDATATWDADAAQRVCLISAPQSLASETKTSRWVS